VAALKFSHLQQRWRIVDLIGKNGRVRTVPMPAWVKVAIDAWTVLASVADGHVFRSVNRANRVTGECLGEKVVSQLIKPYAEEAGFPASPPTIFVARAPSFAEPEAASLSRSNCRWDTASS
jgi:site-specific recombinase XerD